jgi:hypothetical protein
MFGGNKTRQYYYFSSDWGLHRCMEATKQKYMCKQEKPLLSSLMQEKCAVRLLKERKILPGSCEVHYMQLTNTVWKQINDNGYIMYLEKMCSSRPSRRSTEGCRQVVC